MSHKEAIRISIAMGVGVGGWGVMKGDREGVLVNNFIHQMCHHGGGGEVCARFFPKF